MAEASSAAAAPLLRGLPDEIAIWEILVLLPPKSLLRCRAVSRDWRRATSTREFLLAHHGRQPCLPLLYNFELGPSYLDIVPFDHRAAEDQLQSVARLGDAYFCVEASCDGLLVLSDQYRQLSVCNPATRRYALLPQTSGFHFLGMYPHHSTGEYRLLLYPEADDDDEPAGEDACHVFALGSGQPPRSRVASAPVPVLFRGNLHWHVAQRGSGSSLIMVFDTTAESFRQMHSPVHGGTSRLFEMDGTLAVYSYNDRATIIDIWVSQDNERDVWAFKCRVRLPVKEIRVQFRKFDTHWDVKVTSSDDVVLVLVRFGSWLLQIDINGKLVASFHRGRICLTPLRLKQTLVSHNFFPIRKGCIVIDSAFI